MAVESFACIYQRSYMGIVEIDTLLTRARTVICEHCMQPWADFLYQKTTPTYYFTWKCPTCAKEGYERVSPIEIALGIAFNLVTNGHPLPFELRNKLPIRIKQHILLSTLGWETAYDSRE